MKTLEELKESFYKRYVVRNNFTDGEEYVGIYDDDGAIKNLKANKLWQFIEEAIQGERVRIEKILRKHLEGKEARDIIAPVINAMVDNGDLEESKRDKYLQYASEEIADEIEYLRDVDKTEVSLEEIIRAYGEWVYYDGAKGLTLEESVSQAQDLLDKQRKEFVKDLDEVINGNLVKMGDQVIPVAGWRIFTRDLAELKSKYSKSNY